tara:strand:+ start:3791 stop:4132 length:342 start_codon:yes stop_codon:yes gene_type:complete
MAVSNMKITTCRNCGSENLRGYSCSFGSAPLKKHVQCLECAWSIEVKRREPPKHYDQKIQPWDAIEAWHLDFWAGNALKYICRAGKKEGNTAVQDYEKAITYLEECVRRAKDE